MNVIFTYCFVAKRSDGTADSVNPILASLENLCFHLQLHLFLKSFLKGAKVTPFLFY